MDHWRANQLLNGSAGDFDDLLAALKLAKFPAVALAVEALAEVRRGVMTGEGPTTRGRAHFSRTIDAQDAALCERILIAAGGEAGGPVSRQEAEILFDIHESAREREDNGRFDDLFVKAIAHHLLAAAGAKVPSRRVALAAKTPLGAWASAREFAAVDREIAAWIAARLARKRRTLAALDPIAAALIAAGAMPLAMSISSLIDWAL
jgi:hypothetical protein